MKVLKEKILADREMLKGFGEPEKQIEFKAPLPAVFMFQPDTYEVVAKDKLIKWEKLMAMKFGIDFKLHAGFTGTISCCPDCDDCDCDC